MNANGPRIVWGGDEANRMQAPNGYDRTKNPQMIQFRPMTREEGLRLAYGQHPDFLARDGTVRTLKVNGKVRTWKRDPNRIEIPVKYGMYECGTFSWNGERFVSDSQNIFLIVQEKASSDAS